MAHKKYTVTLAKRAEKMLIAHIGFLMQASPSAVDKLLLKLKNENKILSQNPFQYPYADELDAPGIPTETYRKCLIYGRYKLIYRIQQNSVYVDSVIDCRQENKNLYEFIT